MRISDWSSDVCSSDLSANELGAVTDGRHCSAEREGQDRRQGGGCAHELADKRKRKEEAGDIGRYGIARQAQHQRVAQPARHQRLDRKSGVSGKSVSVRVALGGRRIIKKNKQQTNSRKKHNS